MDGLQVMRADVENQHQAVPRSTGKGIGLGATSGGGAAAKQQGATPLRRKALGDITNSRANANKQNSSTPSAKQNPKGGKVEAKAAATPQPSLQPAHSQDVEVATRFAMEEEFSDPAVVEGLDALLEASGPFDLGGSSMHSRSLYCTYRPVKYEEEAPILEKDESEQLVDMLFDDDNEALFDIGDGLSVPGDD